VRLDVAVPGALRSAPSEVQQRFGELPRGKAVVAYCSCSARYYERAIGLPVLGRAALGVGGRELLVLVEEAGARPAHGHTGLYRFVRLVPERPDLVRWLVHAAPVRVPLVGLPDHFVGEAIYLSEPDDHGIEIYWDHPRQHGERRESGVLRACPPSSDHPWPEGPHREPVALGQRDRTHDRP
jgi:hypothetical protein